MPADASKLDESQEKEWLEATTYSALKAPVFTDAISMLIPYMSADVGIACIDEKWRIALNPVFFSLPREQQAFVICHEACHVLNLHFQRARSAHQSDLKSSLLSQDIEIDQQFVDVYGLDMPSSYPMPDDYGLKPFQSMEQYYPIILQGQHDGDGAVGNVGNSQQRGSDASESTSDSSRKPDDTNSSSSSNDKKDDGGDESSNGSHSKPSGCSNDNPEKMSKQADYAGIEGASTASIVSTLEMTRERAVSMMKKYGKSSGNARIADWLADGMTPPKEDWRNLLQSVVSHAKTSKSFQATEQSFSKINKRAAGFIPDVVIPGYVSFNPVVMFALDTSGSMGIDAIKSALTEAQGIIDNGLSGGCTLKAFCVDTQMKDVQMVSDVSDLDVTGRGGTDMMPAFRYINELPVVDRPDLFVLATDGFVPWESCRNHMPTWECSVVILITSHDGVKQVPDWLADIASIIDIDEK